MQRASPTLNCCDFGAAFPSSAQAWLFEVLEQSRFPVRFRSAVEALCAIARACVRGPCSLI
eukprot:7430535-Pyramimonas_sp.AAC.1